jgi:hypothetical protein
MVGVNFHWLATMFSYYEAAACLPVLGRYKRGKK